jgi:kumamolisin
MLRQADSRRLRGGWSPKVFDQTRWAGLIALMNQKLEQSVGFLNPKLYSTAVAQAMRDITNGNNGAFTAGPGWDACTGLGSPNSAPLAAVLSQLSSQMQSGQKAGEPG